jgi:hypothetical protein
MNARTGKPIAQINTRVAVRDMNEPQWKHDSKHWLSSGAASWQSFSRDASAVN